METNKAITVMQERAGSLLEQGDHIGAVKVVELLNYGYILKLKLTRCTKTWDVSVREESNF